MTRRRTAPAVAAAVLMVGLVPLVARAADGDAVARPASPAAPGLDAALEAVPPGGTLLVAVQAADAAAAAEASTAAGATIRATWPEVDAVVAEGAPTSVVRLLADDRVTYVEPDRPVELLLDTSGIATRAEDARDPDSGLLRADGLPYDGSGVSIAVLDSGLDSTHPMFTEDGVTKVARNLRQLCPFGAFCEEYAPVDDSDTLAAGGHGTHVSGIAAGYERTTGDGRVVRGAAPGATLIGLGHGAGLSVLNTSAGLRWVLNNHEDPCGDGSCPPIRVVNNSWGSSPGPHDPDSVQSQLVNDLVANGVTVVFAASNDGGDGSENRISPQAQNPTPGVLSVANYHDDNTGNRNGSLDSSSSRAEKGQVATYPDISAVGSEVISSCRPYMPICYAHASVGDPDREYYQLGGTSMSAPYIAGVAALLYEADPDLTPAEVEDVIEDTAHKFGDPDSYEPDVHHDDGATTSFDKGHGLVDVAAALAAVLGRPDPGTAECAPTASTSSTDPAGDDTRFGVEVGLSELHTEALDVREVSWTWSEEDDELVVVVGVGDLDATPPSGSAGEMFRAFFTVDGARWFAEAVDDRVLGVNGSLAHDGETRTAFADIEVAFDRDAETVTLHVPQAVSAGGFDFSLDDTDVISGFTLESRRVAGALAPVADVAAGGCPVTVSRL